MNKIKMFILIGIFALATAFTSADVMAEEMSGEENQGYDLMLDGGTTQEYVYEMPASGYVTIDVTALSCIKDGMVINPSQWWIPTKIVVDDKVYEDVSVFGDAGTWTSNMLNFKEGTKIRMIFTSTNTSEYRFCYRFKINLTEVKNLETESNNTKKTADKIKINTTYTGIMMQDDTDFYVFTAPKAGKYKVYAVNTDLESTISWFNTTLFNNSYKVVKRSNIISGQGWNKLGTVSLKKGQKIYIKADAYNSGFMYKLKVKKA